MSRSRKQPTGQPVPGDTGLTAGDVGIRVTEVSRRGVLKAGLGVAVGAGVASAFGVAGAPPAHAGINKLAKANARRVGGTAAQPLGSQLTGPTQTGQFGTGLTDIGIPVERSDGVLLFIGGDSYRSDVNPNDDWRSPVALTSTVTNSAGRAVINGAISDQPGRAKPLVIQDHSGGRTSLPTDAFRVGATLYLHVVRGVYQNTVEWSEFYNSDNGGQTWNYLRRWRGSDEYSGQFQQKSYAGATAASDPYIYVMTTSFFRNAPSGLLLFRVLKTDLNKTDADAGASGFGGRYAYQGWGFANGRWAWGNQPTTVLERRTWGEICFRAMDGAYALSWLQTNTNADLIDCRAMRFAYPTTDLTARTEQTMVYNSIRNPSLSPSNQADLEAVESNLYAPFIFPRSTFNNFNFVLSRWTGQGPYDANSHNYCVSQWRTSLRDI